MIIRKISYLGILSLLVFCTKTEKSEVLQTENTGEDSAPLSLVSEDEVAFPINDTVKISGQNGTDTPESIKNPDANMDFTLAHLDKSNNATSAEHQKWLESIIGNNFDDDLPIFSKDVKQIWRDLLDLEYENDRNFTKATFDKKWKGKIDYKYLGWYHFFYNGNDGPEKVKLDATYIGKTRDAYYFKIKVKSIDKNFNWPSQTGKIYKVEKVDGKPLITGIFEKGDSNVWSK